MPAQVFGSAAIATQLYLAFNGLAPGNPVYTNWKGVIDTSGESALALQLGQATANVSSAQLSASVLANLGLSAATTNADAFAALSTAVVQLFDAYPASSRGQIILNMVKLLGGLEGNATYGTAAANFNTSTANAYTYASNPANTTPGSIASGANFTLTTSIDNLTGTGGNDTFNASAVGANTTGSTLNPGDNVNGGAGADTLNIAASTPTVAASTSIVAMTLTGVEKVLVSEFNTTGGAHTIDMALADSSLATVGLSSSDSAGTLEVTGLKKVVDAEMKSGANSLTFTFASGNTGTADQVNLAVAGQTAGTFTANGIETVAVTSTVSKSSVTLAGSTLAKVTVAGDTEVAVVVPATALEIDASAATGKVTIDTEAVTLASITSAKGGAGTTDVIKIDEAVSASSKLSKISGFETLAISAGVAVNLDAALAGVSTIDMTKADGAATTLTLATGYTGATAVVITAGTGGDTITNTANVALSVTGNVADAARVAISAGTGTTDMLHLYADGAGASVLSTVTGFETIHILANKTTASTATGTITMDNANVAAGKTMTIDASALTNSAAALTFVGTAETDGKFSITGGAGNDAITGGNGGDTINGGAGNDVITAGTGADNLSGGDGNDTFTMAGNLTSADTIDGGAGTDTLSVSTISTSSAFANVTNVEKIAISSAAAFSLSAPVAADLTLDLSNTGIQSVTLASGYTGATTVILTGDGGSGDDVINSANVALTVKANETDLVAGSTLTGGTGVDVLEVTATSAANANLSNVTLFETIKVLPNATTATESVTLDALAAVGAGKSITIDGSALTTSTAKLTISNLAASAGNFNVVGGAAGDALDLNSITGNATVDGGAGNDTITAGSGVDSLSGGAGNDTFTMTNRLSVQDTIDGGDGTDTISITTYNPASLTNVKNVEVLAVTGANTATIDSTANGFTSFNLRNADAQLLELKAGYTGAATVSITGAVGDDITNGAVVAGTGKVDATNSPLWANTTLTVVGNVGDFTADSTITGGTGSDTLQMTADNSGTGAVLTNVRAVETITVKASAGNAAKITVTDARVVPDGATLTVNASDLSTTNATLTYDGSAITGTATGKQNVTGSANGDYIKGGSGADSIDGGAGNDTIISGTGLDTIVSGSGADVINVNTSSNALEFATVTDFAATDRLFFEDGGTAAGSTTLSKVTLSSAATLSDYIHAAASGTGGGTNATVKWFNFGTNTYVVQDRSNNAAFTAGTDRVIELQGTLDLTDTTKAVLTAADIGAAKTQTLTFAATGNGVTAALAAPAFVFAQTSAADAKWVGTAGADTFTFGAFLTAADTVTGGGGADTLSFTDANSAATDLDNVSFTSASTITLGDAVTSVTTLNGLINANTLTVNGGALTGTNTLTWNGAAETDGTFSITGGAGGDTITGGDLADTIAGGNGADSLVGGAGGDSITGGNGVDSIVAGTGADTITGGAEADIINVGAGDAAIDVLIWATGAGLDVVTGFLAGAGGDQVSGGVSTGGAAATVVSTIDATTAITMAATDEVLVIRTADSATFADLAAVKTRLEVGAESFAASDSYYVVYSNAAGVTQIALLTTDAVAGIGAGDTLENIVQIVGSTDTTTITAANFTVVA